MQEMEFPQISYNNSISVSGSLPTKVMHTGPCAFVTLSSLQMCGIWEPVQVLDGWDTWLLGPTGARDHWETP